MVLNIFILEKLLHRLLLSYITEDSAVALKEPVYVYQTSRFLWYMIGNMITIILF